MTSLLWGPWQASAGRKDSRNVCVGVVCGCHVCVCVCVCVCELALMSGDKEGSLIIQPKAKKV